MNARAEWAKVPITALANGIPVPLSIEGACVLSSPDRYAQCEAAVKAAQAFGYPVLCGRGAASQAPCVIVGSGPSAIPLLPEIRARYERGEEIIAVKGAHDWLVKNGIVPRAAIAMDGQQSRAKCFKRLRREVLYLCASQMHPDTWAHLRGQRVLVWHSRIATDQQDRPGWENAYLVPCCTTTGNSAIVLMFIFGRRNFELYGFDSSLPPVIGWWQTLLAKFKGRSLKLDGARVPEGKQVGDVVIGNQTFETTPELVHQATEMQTMFEQLVESAKAGDWPMPEIKVNAHGRGYYQALLAEGKAQGWPV